MNSSLEKKTGRFALPLPFLAAFLALGAAFLIAIPIRILTDAVEPPVSGVPLKPLASLELIEQGRQLFALSCAECHGDDAHGEEGPDLHNLSFSNAYITAVIKKGIRGEMPPFHKKYDDAQIRALLAYLRSLH